VPKTLNMLISFNARRPQQPKLNVPKFVTKHPKKKGRGMEKSRTLSAAGHVSLRF